MNYFLAGPNNSLTHLPDFTLEPGKYEIREAATLQGPRFLRGPKMPDACFFSKPSGVEISGRVNVVSDEGVVRIIRVTVLNIDLTHTFLAGTVDDQYDVSSDNEAMALINTAVENIG